MCTKEIDDSAKMCPYCRSRQTVFEKHKNIFLLSFLAVLMLFIFFPQIKYHYTHVEFAPYLKDMSISETSIRFKTDNYGVQAIAMGKLTNNTPYTWYDVLFELSLYNSKNELIDTMQTKAYSQFPAGQSLQFKLLAPIVLNKNEYDNFKLKIVTATNKDKWSLL